ncbi:hypothetical protein E2C01_019505 [Portunus trituberculatus]|uniref:Uncharacterized protein n=1 Tax=Portunus trituberculatus TaxID=210409 RepID=A0A5B7DXT6_PORTR|nr:hypothetical protein [Portunus trituberculatus]
MTLPSSLLSPQGEATSSYREEQPIEIKVQAHFLNQRLGTNECSAAGLDITMQLVGTVEEYGRGLPMT